MQVAVSKATSIQFSFLAEDIPGGQPLGVRMLTLSTGCLSLAAPGIFLQRSPRPSTASSLTGSRPAWRRMGLVEHVVRVLAFRYVAVTSFSEAWTAERS